MGGFRPVLPGLTISCGVAFISFLISGMHPSFDFLILSVFIGLFVSNLFASREVFNPGVEFVLKTALPLGIGLFGAGLIFKGEIKALWPVVLLVFPVLFLFSYYMARAMGLETEMALLLGVGMSICGVSAIAIISGISGAKRENTSAALVSIIAAGLAGMLFLILFSNMLGISPRETAIMSGATLPAVSMVKIASAGGGPEFMPFALDLKLLRVALIGFFALAVLFIKRRERPFAFPWFMVLFFVLSTLFNVFELGALGRYLSGASQFLLAISLAAIGLTVEFEVLSDRGLRPFAAAFLAWGAGALLAYILIIGL